MSRAISIGVIGIGFGQQVHVPAFRQNPRCAVTAICASQADRAERVAGELNIVRWSGDWRELIGDSAVDAVSIAVPAPLQAVIVEAAAAAGKHVFCEKPLASDHAGAVRMLDAVKRARVIHSVDFLFPEIERWQEAKRLIDRGELGLIRHAAVTWKIETNAFSRQMASWKRKAEAGGGVLNSFVSHSLYYLEWLFGPICRLNARIVHQPDRSESSVDSWMDLLAGFPLTLSVASDAFGGSGHRLEIYGSEGALVLENRTREHAGGFTLSGSMRSGSAIEWTESAPSNVDGRVAAVSRMVDRFIDAILDVGSMTPNLVHGVRVQLLLDAMRRSSASQMWQDVVPG